MIKLFFNFTAVIIMVAIGAILEFTIACFKKGYPILRDGIISFSQKTGSKLRGFWFNDPYRGLSAV